MTPTRPPGGTSSGTPPAAETAAGHDAALAPSALALFAGLLRRLRLQPSGMRHAIEQARATLGGPPSQALLLDLLDGVARSHEGDWRGGTEALMALLPRLRAGSDPLPLIVALTALGGAQVQLGGYVHASAFLREALVLARQHNLPQERGHALIAAGLLHVHFAQFDIARDAFTEARTLLGEAVPPDATLHIAGNLGYCALLAGLPAQAEALLREGLATTAEGTRPLIEAIAHANLSWALADLGRPAEAEQAWRAARSLQRRHALGRLQAPLALNRARILAARGRRQQALRLGQLARRLLHHQGRPLYHEHTLVFLAEQAEAQGLWSSAYRYAAELSAHRQAVGARVLADLAEGIDSVLMHTREAAELRVQRQWQLELDRRVADATRALAESEARARQLAERDALTLLPNRRALETTLPRRLTEVTRLCVVSLRLPHLDELASVLGSGATEALLRQVAARLQHGFDVGTVFAHRDGQFVLCLSSPEALQRPESVAAELADRVQTLANGTGVPFAVAVGWARYPEQGLQSDELVQRAELAAAGTLAPGERRLRPFEMPLQDNLRQRTRLEAALRQALAAGELQLWLQPQIALDSGLQRGAEGLVRWQHPSRGLLAPAEFIGVAEDTGLIVDIDHWMLGQVAAWVAARHAEGKPVVGAVNLSAKTMLEGRLLERLQAVLRRHHLPAWALELELTEGTLIEQVTPALARLQALRSLGVQVALDDFGTGYSSLAYLGQLPITALKIDRAFVRGLPNDARSKAIVEAVVRLGQALDLHLVAEGVEHPEQARWLASLGVHSGQGYWWGRPVPCAEG